MANPATKGMSILAKVFKVITKTTNPINQKTVIAEVISNKVKFSDFYNSVK